MVPPCRRDPPDAGPARCGKSSRVCPFDGGYDPFGSGEADGTAEEAEFADNLQPPVGRGCGLRR